MTGVSKVTTRTGSPARPTEVEPGGRNDVTDDTPSTIATGTTPATPEPHPPGGARRLGPQGGQVARLLEDVGTAYQAEASQSAALAATRARIVVLLRELRALRAPSVAIARAILRAKGQRPTPSRLTAAARALRERAARAARTKAAAGPGSSVRSPHR